MGNESVVKEERQRKDQIWSEAEVVTLKKQEKEIQSIWSTSFRS